MRLSKDRPSLTVGLFLYRIKVITIYHYEEPGMKKLFLSFLLFSFSVIAGCGGGNTVSTEQNTEAVSADRSESKEKTTPVVSERTIMVENRNGSVEAYDGKETVYLVEGDKLLSGREVTTGFEADLTLLLDADKHVYAAESTKFKIIALGKANSSRTRIDLVKGTLVGGIDNKLGKDETFAVTTPNAVMAVRGTVFTVEVTKSKGEYITKLTVTEGSVETATIEDGTEKKVTVSAGETAEFAGEAPEIEPEPEEIEEARIREEEYKNRFKTYESDPEKETINFPKPDSPDTIEVDYVVISGAIWKFEEYFKEECEDYMSRGYGIGHTGYVFVPDEPVTMPDGTTWEVVDFGLQDKGGLSWDNLPVQKHGKFYGYFCPTTMAEAWNTDSNGNEWVNIDTIIICEDWWTFSLKDAETD